MTRTPELAPDTLARLQQLRSEVTPLPYPGDHEQGRPARPGLLIDLRAAVQLTPAPLTLRRALWLSEVRGVPAAQLLTFRPALQGPQVLLAWDHPARPLLSLADLSPERRVDGEAGARIHAAQDAWTATDHPGPGRCLAHPDAPHLTRADLHCSAHDAQRLMQRKQRWLSAALRRNAAPLSAPHLSTQDLRNVPADTLPALTDWPWVYAAARRDALHDHPSASASAYASASGRVTLLLTPQLTLGLDHHGGVRLLSGRYRGFTLDSTHLALLGAPTTTGQPDHSRSVPDTTARASQLLGVHIPDHWNVLSSPARPPGHQPDTHPTTPASAWDVTAWPPGSPWALHQGWIPNHGWAQLARIRPPTARPRKWPFNWR